MVAKAQRWIDNIVKFLISHKIRTDRTCPEYIKIKLQNLKRVLDSHCGKRSPAGEAAQYLQVAISNAVRVSIEYSHSKINLEKSIKDSWRTSTNLVPRPLCSRSKKFEKALGTRLDFDHPSVVGPTELETRWRQASYKTFYSARRRWWSSALEAKTNWLEGLLK